MIRIIINDLLIRLPGKDHTLRPAITVLLFSLLLPALNSCSTGGCDKDTDNNMVMTLFESGESAKKITDSITVFGTMMPDSLLYDNYSTDQVLLQPDPSASHSSFVIQKGQQADTIDIEYSASQRFVSKECGYTYYYIISDVIFTANWIDTVLVIDANIEIPDNENLRTFY